MSRAEYVREIISELTPVEVFDFYDGPTFYSCQDKTGQLFIVYWADEELETKSWLYIRISKDRYVQLKNGNITIFDALSRPEEGFAYVVKTINSAFSVSQLESTEIPHEWLPPQDDKLLLPTPSLPEKINSAKEIASATLRQVLDLAFERAANHYEIGCGRLGKLLDATQNTLFALACDQKSDVRRVPEEIKYQSEVLVTGLFASSFGVRLQSRTSDLFAGDRVATATEMLATLLSDSVVPEVITEKLMSFNVLTRSRFKHLIRVLVEAEVSIKTEWGSPSGKFISSRTSHRELVRTLNALDRTDEATTQETERPGKLVGVDVESDFFALMLEDKEVIKGRLAKGLANHQFEIPSMVVANLEETCVIDPLTEREKWSYVLINVREHAI